MDKEEIPALKKTKDIEEINGEGFFLQPCDKLGCDGCTIYGQRPKKCREFNCSLLSSLEQKEIEFNSALEIVKLIKQKINLIENKIEELNLELKSESFYFRIIELKNKFEKNKSEFSHDKNIQILISEINDLDELTTERFGISF